MFYFDNILFFILLVIGIGLFIKNMKKVYQNISLGKKTPHINQRKERWFLVLKVAFGQGRINQKPLVGVLHFLVYLGFFIINLEFFEILIDGLFGKHRFFAPIFGEKYYSLFTATLEVFALLTAMAVVVFFLRRNLVKVSRLNHPDLKGWAKQDANYILILEFLIMWAFLQANASDFILQTRGVYPHVGFFPISEFIFVPFLENLDDTVLMIIERSSWWFHFIVILLFLNYLYYSKHLHILLAFPNIWYSYKENKGEMNNLKAVTQEIQLMLNPNAIQENPTNIPKKFGAEDVFDLNKIQLLNAYSCVECGRCTEVCPANITGKKLSPRKIMMSVRDRLQEVTKIQQPDNKTLLNDYISPEEIWACTTCLACSESCPLYIDPASVIIDLRRFLVMEQSSAPQELHKAMSNIENNATPWSYNPEDRAKWINE